MKQDLSLRQVFVVEVLLLFLAAPLLYFPDRFPTGALWLAFTLLTCGWLWRRWQLGIWRVTTPADWPLFLLFLVMLPISLWAAPEPLRMQYSWPRAYILIWNFCLFWVVVVYSQQDVRLFQVCLHGFIAVGVLIALVAPLGMAWLYKFPLLERLLQQIPTPLLGVFAGAESGFHPNQVAGTLLYVLPLALVLAVEKAYWREWSVQNLWLFVASLVMLGVLLLTQSRASLLGLATGVALTGIVLIKQKKYTVGGGFILLILVYASLAWADHSTFLTSLIGRNSLEERQEIWFRAILGIQEFSFTGMGLGTFRAIMPVLYPLLSIPNIDMGHAHNFFLQTALDFGFLGLFALIALFLLAIVSAYRQCSSPNRSAVAIGSLACVFSQIFYSQLDSVSMGSKTNLFLWYLFALIFSQILPPSAKRTENIH